MTNGSDYIEMRESYDYDDHYDTERDRGLWQQEREEYEQWMESRSWWDKLIDYIRRFV